MVEFSPELWQTYLAQFLWPFFRIAAFFSIAPIWGEMSSPTTVKVSLAGLVAFILMMTGLPMIEVPVSSYAGLVVIVEQVLIGLAMGLAVKIILTATQFTGEVAALQMGLGFASFFSPESQSNTAVISRFLFVITMLMFLAFDGHLRTLEVLAESFEILPIGMSLDTQAFDIPGRLVATMIVSGMLLALPLIAALFIVQVALGVLNRSAPQFTVFSVGFPMSITVGVVMLFLITSGMSRFLETLFSQALEAQLTIVQALAG